MCRWYSNTGSLRDIASVGYLALTRQLLPEPLGEILAGSVSRWSSFRIGFDSWQIFIDEAPETTLVGYISQLLDLSRKGHLAQLYFRYNEDRPRVAEMLTIILERRFLPITEDAIRAALRWDSALPLERLATDILLKHGASVDTITPDTILLAWDELLPIKELLTHPATTESAVPATLDAAARWTGPTEDAVWEDVQFVVSRYPSMVRTHVGEAFINRLTTCKGYREYVIRNKVLEQLLSLEGSDASFVEAIKQARDRLRSGFSASVGQDLQRQSKHGPRFLNIRDFV